MKPGLLFFFLLWSVFAQGQVKAHAVPRTGLPQGVRYEGSFLDALQWTDKDGTHLVVRSESGVIQAKGEEAASSEVYGAHYLLGPSGPKSDWKLLDFIRDCEVDLICRFIRPSFQVTDLDKDGKGEVWLLYRLSCHGDVGPSRQKLIMYEGGKKHALRGETRAVLGGTDYGGGKYELDEAFRSAPVAIRSFAEALWKKYEREFDIPEDWLGANATKMSVPLSTGKILLCSVCSSSCPWSG